MAISLTKICATKPTSITPNLIFLQNLSTKKKTPNLIYFLQICNSVHPQITHLKQKHDTSIYCLHLVMSYFPFLSNVHSFLSYLVATARRGYFLWQLRPLVSDMSKSFPSTPSANFQSN